MARTATKSKASALSDKDSVDVATTKDNSKSKATKIKTEIAKEIDDNEEIMVMSLVSNVTYEDKKTGDTIVWEEAGQEEPMTFEMIKNMWRNHKTYFKNLLLKPLDDRIIAFLGLEKLYTSYEDLLDENKYTINNIDKMCDSIKQTPNSLKSNIYHKIVQFVKDEKITNIKVIRELERELDTDLISYL